MTAPDPITAAESVALAKFGWRFEDASSLDGAAAVVLQAYRAGFRDGRKPRIGDPNPKDLP